MTTPTQEREEEKETSRVEAFSDGVFAIAITLLVLGLIEMPHPPEGEPLLRALLRDWERFVAFAVGFCTILVCWINHHHMMRYIRRLDSRFMWVNGFLLFLVTFIPFPTDILARYVGTEPTAAVALFGFGYFMIAFAYGWVWSYACDHGLVDPAGDRGYFRAVRMTYRAATIYTLLTFPVCFVSVTAAAVLYAVMFAVFAFPHEFALRLAAFAIPRRPERPQAG